MLRPQFTLRALLVLLLAVACFFGGIRFERERRRREDEAAAEAAQAAAQPDPGFIYSPDYRFRMLETAGKSPSVDSEK